MTRKVDILPKGFGSLAHGLPPAPRGTLFAMGQHGGMSVAPDAGFDLLFGRGEPDVHVCVGGSDQHVSRRHGHIAREGSRWVLHNTGKLAIRFPGSRLVLGGQSAELATAYTPLFVVAPRQEHLLEVRIATGAPPAGGDRYEAGTADAGPWSLSPVEHLVLVCLGRRYLCQDFHPQPLTWAQVADELGRLRPQERWTGKRAARIVTRYASASAPRFPACAKRRSPAPGKRPQPQPHHGATGHRHDRGIGPGFPRRTPGPPALVGVYAPDRSAPPLGADRSFRAGIVVASRDVTILEADLIVPSGGPAHCPSTVV